VIRIAISAEAFAAIEATMPLGSVAVEPAANDRSEREIWLDEGSSTASTRPSRQHGPQDRLLA
jgi:hypothetical protein